MKKDRGGCRVGNLGVGRILATSLVLMLLCAHGMAASLSEYHFDLSGGALDIQLPEHRSRDFFESTVVTGVQIEDERNYDSSSRRVRLLQRAVDYRAGFPFNRSFGVMVITISVVKWANNTEGDCIFRPDDFATQFGMFGRFSEGPRRIMHHGNEWCVFTVSSPSGSEQKFFAAPLGGDKYLLIKFKLIDNSLGAPAKWKYAAHADMQKIFSSAKLENPGSISDGVGIR